MQSRIRGQSTDPVALIIDAEPDRLNSLGRWVGRAGFAPRSAETTEKARSELAAGDFDLVLADTGLLDAESRVLLDELSNRSVPVTGTCLDTAALPQAGSRRPALSRFGRLIGGSAAMQHVFDLMLRVARTDATVFLIGESGTGKELAAELVHGLSPRAAQPFVPVNCGALSPSLIESELFGHERGSFTGADRRRPGLFERAQGGTLFLDEITEMPLDLQVKLLRVLESGKVRRVGGTEQVDVDVRMVAATNRDPDEAVTQGHLREDLLYRLLVFPLELPPLRQRCDDIERIADHYLLRLNDRTQTGKTFSPEALEALRSHDWPGNVRELHNTVERAFILSDDVIQENCFASDLLPPSGGDANDIGIRVGMPIAQAERRLIEATLKRLGGDKKEAARMLGISIKTLYSRLSVYRAAVGEGRAKR